jgi:hypothetical protein
MTLEETKNLIKTAHASKFVYAFTRALAPPFIGRRRDFYIPNVPSNLRNIPNVNTYMNVFCISYIYKSATSSHVNPDFWGNVFDLASYWFMSPLSIETFTRHNPRIWSSVDSRISQIPISEFRRFRIPDFFWFVTSGLRRFKIPDLQRFVTSGLRRFKIPDLRRFATAGLRRFKIPHLRRFATLGLRRFKISVLHRFATSGLRRFKIPDLRRFATSGFAGSRFQIFADSRLRGFAGSRFQIFAMFSHPENSFHESRQTRRFEGHRFLLNSPTLAPRGSGLTPPIRFHENI